MAKKIILITASALAMAGFIALAWWWFLGVAPQTINPSGTFGTAGNRTDTGAPGREPTNVGASILGTKTVTIPTVAGLSNLAAGTYVLKSVKGTSLGSYTITPQSKLPGVYTVTALPGAKQVLPPGTYTVQTISGQTVATYTALPAVTSPTPSNQPLGTYTVQANNLSLVAQVNSPTPLPQGSYVFIAPTPLPAGPHTLISTAPSGGEALQKYVYTTSPSGTVLAYTVTGTAPSGGAPLPLAPPTPSGGGEPLTYTYTASSGGGTTTQSISLGTYTVSTDAGQPLGFYSIDSGGGVYVQTNTPLQEVGLPAAATSTPYLGTIDTPGVAWYFSAPDSVDFGPTTPTNTGGGTIVDAPGTVFNPTNVNGINGSNPQGGLLPNFDASLGGNSNGGLGLGGALIGAAGSALIGCGAGLALSAGATAIGGALGIGSSVVGTAGTVAGAGAEGAKAIAASVSSISPAAGSAIGAATGATPVAASVASDAAEAGGVAGGGGGGGASALASVFTLDISNAISNIMQGMTLSGILSANTSNTALHLKDETDTFMGCVARTFARAALRQITTSVVNWINSGFKGNPSFVTNPTQFFTNVADVAAGQFIQGSALSFLCSPFKLQIKIAVAYSYAHANENSCTLTGVTNNINNFINNSFNSGGWPTFLSFTMTPTNNSYGAYAYAKNGLNSSVAQAQNAFSVQLNQGRGFLSLQQQQNCKNTSTLPSGVNPNQFVQSLGAGSTVSANGTVTNGGVVLTGGVGTANKQSVSVASDNGQQGPTPSGGTVGAVYQVCDLVTTTPGSVIAGSIDKTLGVSQDSLNMAKNFDEIISALITQLMTNVLQLGLTNVSGSNGTANSAYYTQDQQAAQAAGQSLITKMQGETTSYQQMGTIKQGEIGDIQTAQSQLNTLRTCWNSAVVAAQAVVNALRPPTPQNMSDGEGGYYASFNALTPDIQQFNIVSSTAHTNLALAQARVQSINDTITSYETQVAVLNANITNINTAIALLEQYQSRMLSVGSTAEVGQITNEYISAQVHITQTDLTTEQQNRASLQSQIATLGGNTIASGTQCTTLRMQIANPNTTTRP
ncbi:MAG: hypothetical protein WCI89_00655 [bacterium]